MIVSHPLTSEERKLSQRNYIRFGLINGFSYMCLGETIIILLAVQIHMPDVLITFVGAMLYIGFLLLPLGVRQTAKTGAAQSQATFWVYRNIAALLVAVSAVLARFQEECAWALLLLAALMFYGFRAAGVVLSQPLIGEITNDDDRSQLIGNATGAFYFSGVVALLSVSFLLKQSSSVWILCGIVVFGATMGVTASRFLREIRETDVIRQTASRPLIPQWKKVKSNPMIRQLLMAGFCKNLIVILMVPASVLYLKKGYGFTDTQAVLFSAAQFCASFASSCLSGKIVAKRGPRVVLIAGSLLGILISLLWLIAPSSGIVIPCIISVLVFFMCGTMVAIGDNANTCYFLMAVPKEQQIAGSVATNVIQGAGAGISGMIIAGGLMWLAEWVTPHVFEATQNFVGLEGKQILTYKLFFLFTLPVQLFSLYQMIRLKTIIKTFRDAHGDEEVRRTVESGRKGAH